MSELFDTCKLKDADKYIESIQSMVRETNLKEDCINKAFGNQLFNLDNFNRNLDKLIKFTLDGLKSCGVKKPATLFMEYIKFECESNDILARYIESPKSGTLLIEFYQRLKNTLEILARYQKGEKNLEGELKRRKVL